MAMPKLMPVQVQAKVNWRRELFRLWIGGSATIRDCHRIHQLQRNQRRSLTLSLHPLPSRDKT